MKKARIILALFVSSSPCMAAELEAPLLSDVRPVAADSLATVASGSPLLGPAYQAARADYFLRRAKSLDASRTPNEGRIRAIALALKQKGLTAPILDPTSPRAADVVRDGLAAYKRGAISLEEFASLTMRWQAAKEYGSRASQSAVIPLFGEDGNLTPFADRVLAARPPTQLLLKEYKFGRASAPYRYQGLKGRALRRFEGLMRAVPKSERSFYILRLTVDTAYAPEVWGTGILLDVAPGLHGSPLFYEPKGEGPYYSIIVPSFSMLQAFINAKFPANAVKLFPYLGNASIKTLMRSVAQGGRIVSLAFPKMPFSTRDGWATYGPHVFAHHDFYHAIAASNFPENYRRFFPRARELLKANAERLDARVIRRRILKMIDFSMNSFWRPELRDFYGMIKADFTIPERRIISRDVREHPDYYLGLGVKPAKLISALLTPK